MKECTALSLANLVAYMEKEKSTLRNLKRSYRNKKKQDEACRINKLFQLDHSVVSRPDGPRKY